MEELYSSSAERAMHAQAMEALASEIQRDVSDVRPVYEDVYRELHGRARVREFLPLFVARRTRTLLRQSPR